ncbi:MAG: hypothetical protein IJC36_00180 [Clostridia bacterium]|nr:hypothetical protein [Clostridia bacterium]
MKKLLALLLVVMMVLSLSACGENQQTEQNTGNNQTQSTNNNDDISTDNGKTNVDTTPSTNTSANTIEELEGIITKDIEDTVNALNSEWETLSATITTYDAYVKNAEKVEQFYEKINTQTEQACIRLQEYAVKYAEMIMTSDMSNDDKYDAFDELNDCIYDDAADDLNDGIYDGLLKDMQDALYEGVLDDSDDAPSYSDWYDVHSDEYENWYDTRSDVYEVWYDTRSDVYSFYYDMRGELWGDDIEKTQKTLDDYKADVEKLKK